MVKLIILVNCPLTMIFKYLTFFRRALHSRSIKNTIHMTELLDQTSIRENFLKSLSTHSLSVPLLNFALAIDNALPSAISSRDDHIANIIEQVFGIRIDCHRLIDFLTMMKFKLDDGNFLLNHNQDIKKELYRYASNQVKIFAYPKSTRFCLPISIEPIFQKCPQCVTDFLLFKDALHA